MSAHRPDAFVVDDDLLEMFWLLISKTLEIIRMLGCSYFQFQHY